MHRPVILPCVLGLLAMAGGVQAQGSQWAYFQGENGLLQAGVQAAGGEQLILKCDERGDGEVFAVIFSPTRLKPPSSRPQPRPVRMRFDGGRVIEDSWRHYEQTAMALNTRRDRTLPPFLNNLVDANDLQVFLDPVDGTRIEVNFHVSGAREAIARVYASCEDGDNPVADEAQAE